MGITKKSGNCVSDTYGDFIAHHEAIHPGSQQPATHGWHIGVRTYEKLSCDRKPPG